MPVIQVHLDPVAVKSAIKNYLLKPLGLAYVTCKPERSQHTVLRNTERSETTAACSKSTMWQLDDVNLRSGWYMLEVEHSRHTIGCVLSLEVPGNHSEYLLLTSKRVCKRIVYLETKLSQSIVRIDQPQCSLKRLSLSVLTSRFATSRMKSRLSNRGSLEDLHHSNLERLYSAYQAHIHDGMEPRHYRPETVENSITETSTAIIDGRQPAPELLLMCHSDENLRDLHESVDLAIVFARQRGWNIKWRNLEREAVCESHSSQDSRVFIMQIHSSVEYRVDIFDQMLAVIGGNSVLVYADHDHIDGSGNYLNPVLKPEWNPELLLNANYVQLPWMISESWASSGFSVKQYTNEWFELLLLSAALHSVSNNESHTVGQDRRETKSVTLGEPLATGIPLALTYKQIQRIPKVLASVLLPDSEDKPKNTGAAWRHNLYSVLQRAGKRAEITESRYPERYRIKWPLPMVLPTVDIIIPTRDQVAVLRTCIESIYEKTSYVRYRVVVVDNGSCEPATERYYESLGNELRFSLLRYPGEFNYSAINNFAASKSSADVLVLLNNDTEVISEHWLDELVRQAIRPEIGCVGAKLYYSNGRIQHGGVIVGIAGVAGHAHRYSSGNAHGYCGRLTVPQNLTAVTAACLAVKRSVFFQADGLDEKHLAVAWNDVDFCLKVQALGYRNIWTPHAELYHHEGLSRGADDTGEKILRVENERRVMMERWALETYEDPAYHPLLTRDNETFGLGKSIS